MAASVGWFRVAEPDHLHATRWVSSCSTHPTDLLRLREQLGAPAGEPVDQQPDPFVPGRIGALEAIAQGSERTAQILWAAGAPVDRIGLDRKADAAESADRARHVVCGGDEQ